MRTSDIRNAVIFRPDSYTYKWYDIIGEAQKFQLQNGFPTDDTTGDPTQFAYTVTEAGAGNTTAVNSTAAETTMLITTAANEYDGANLQLKGEQFKLSTDRPLYFGAKFKVSDATQSDIFIGLAETDTTLMATASAHAIALGGDGAFFAKLDGSTTIAAEMYLDGAETATADYGTALVDDTYITVEIYFDGEKVSYYVDDTLVTCVSASLADGDMTPSINFRAGAAAAKTMTIAWIKCFQVG